MKTGERQCLKWYDLLCSTCFTEVLLLGLCHLQMPLYLLSGGNLSPFVSWFMFGISKIWCTTFYPFQPQRSSLEFPYECVYMKLFLCFSIHSCTHQSPEHLSAAWSPFSLEHLALPCRGQVYGFLQQRGHFGPSPASRVRYSLDIQGLRLQRELTPGSEPDSSVCIASWVSQYFEKLCFGSWAHWPAFLPLQHKCLPLKSLTAKLLRRCSTHLQRRPTPGPQTEYAALLLKLTDLSSNLNVTCPGKQ